MHRIEIEQMPTTTSAPMSRNACARSSSFRTIARTALPWFNSSSVTARPTAPTRPAAPVTRMGFAMFFLLCVQLNRKTHLVECGCRIASVRRLQVPLRMSV
jgi:hypothetical protein